MAHEHRAGQANKLSQLGAAEGRRSLGSLGGLGMKQSACAVGPRGQGEPVSSLKSLSYELGPTSI